MNKTKKKRKFGCQMPRNSAYSGQNVAPQKINPHCRKCEYALNGKKKKKRIFVDVNLVKDLKRRSFWII